MAVHTTDYPARRRDALPWRKILAVVAQLASWATTFWFVQWLWPEGPLAWQVACAVVAEALLTVCKAQLFNGDDTALGWTGLLVDGIINAGGLLPKACKVWTFPPVAAFVAALGGATTCSTFGLASVLIALVFGFALSALPHRLWH